MMLKGMGHESIDETLKEEKRLGNRIEYRDGRYYSERPSGYPAPPSYEQSPYPQIERPREPEGGSSILQPLAQLSDEDLSSNPGDAYRQVLATMNVSPKEAIDRFMYSEKGGGGFVGTAVGPEGPDRVESLAGQIFEIAKLEGPRFAGAVAGAKAGGMAGSALGPWGTFAGATIGAAIGAITGDAVRQGIQFGEIDWGEMLKEGAWYGLGEGAGRAIARAGTAIVKKGGPAAKKFVEESEFVNKTIGKYMPDKGPVLTAGEAGGSKIMKFFEREMDDTAMLRGPYRKFRQSRQKELTEIADDVVKKLGRKQTTKGLGEELAEHVGGLESELHNVMRRKYSHLSELTKNLMVRTDILKAKLRPMATKYDTSLKHIADDIEDIVPFEQMYGIRRMLLAEAQDVKSLKPGGTMHKKMEQAAEIVRRQMEVALREHGKKTGTYAYETYKSLTELETVYSRQFKNDVIGEIMRRADIKELGPYTIPDYISLDVDRVYKLKSFLKNNLDEPTFDRTWKRYQSWFIDKVFTDAADESTGVIVGKNLRKILNEDIEAAVLGNVFKAPEVKGLKDLARAIEVVQARQGQAVIRGPKIGFNQPIGLLKIGTGIAGAYQMLEGDYKTGAAIALSPWVASKIMLTKNGRKLMMAMIRANPENAAKNAAMVSKMAVTAKQIDLPRREYEEEGFEDYEPGEKKNFKEADYTLSAQPAGYITFQPEEELSDEELGIKPPRGEDWWHLRFGDEPEADELERLEQQQTIRRRVPTPKIKPKPEIRPIDRVRDAAEVHTRVGQKALSALEQGWPRESVEHEFGSGGIAETNPGMYDPIDLFIDLTFGVLTGGGWIAAKGLGNTAINKAFPIATKNLIKALGKNVGKEVVTGGTAGALMELADTAGGGTVVSIMSGILGPAAAQNVLTMTRRGAAKFMQDFATKHPEKYEGLMKKLHLYRDEPLVKALTKDEQKIIDAFGRESMKGRMLEIATGDRPEKVVEVLSRALGPTGTHAILTMSRQDAADFMKRLALKNHPIYTEILKGIKPYTDTRIAQVLKGRKKAIEADLSKEEYKQLVRDAIKKTFK
jgi:hypothetical protein